MKARRNSNDEREIPLGHIYVVLAVIPFGYNSILLPSVS